MNKDTQDDGDAAGNSECYKSGNDETLHGESDVLAERHRAATKAAHAKSVSVEAERRHAAKSWRRR
jgi:hypothetical protein